jgi:hypothetical protein
MLMRYHYGLGVGHIYAGDMHLPTLTDEGDEPEEHSPSHTDGDSEPELDSYDSDLLDEVDDSGDSRDGDMADDEFLDMYDMYGL